MKIRMKNIVGLLLCSLFILSCGKNNQEPEDNTFRIETKVKGLNVGQKLQLEVKGVPKDQMDQVFWESTNPRVIVVSPTGAIQAISEGRATINASYGEAESHINFVVSAVSIDTNGEAFELNVEKFKHYVWDYEKNPNAIAYLGNKPAIVDFWASWCGPCKAIRPFIDEMAKKYKDKAYVFSVNYDGIDKSGANKDIYRAVKKIYTTILDKEYLPMFLLLPPDGSSPIVMKGVGKETTIMIEQFLSGNVNK